ncbi:MAG: CAP domain-containing protein [Chlorobiaceae bacterium]|nr:CAP domain-containing protein [Chlorobiaceae bacterium]
MDRAVVAEINLLRSDPAGYGRKYLLPLRKLYQGGLLCYPGSIPMRTREGVSALDECLRELERTGPLPGLSASRGLTLAARDHVQDQGPTGTIGHTGSDGSSLTSRIERYGQWDLSAGENISYGYRDARKILIALLIDDGVASRGHRKNLLNGSFRTVGVDVGPHRVYGDMCVMDFAGGYRSR